MGRQHRTHAVLPGCGICKVPGQAQVRHNDSEMPETKQVKFFTHQILSIFQTCGKTLLSPRLAQGGHPSRTSQHHAGWDMLRKRTGHVLVWLSYGLRRGKRKEEIVPSSPDSMRTKYKHLLINKTL